MLAELRILMPRWIDVIIIMAVLYVTREKHYILPLYFLLLLLLLLLSFQKVISEVTERIPFILSHDIRSGCNLLMHPKR